MTTDLTTLLDRAVQGDSIVFGVGSEVHKQVLALVQRAEDAIDAQAHLQEQLDYTAHDLIAVAKKLGIERTYSEQQKQRAEDARRALDVLGAAVANLKKARSLSCMCDEDSVCSVCQLADAMNETTAALHPQPHGADPTDEQVREWAAMEERAINKESEQTDGL